MDQYGKKGGRNLELIKQGKGKDAEVFVGNNRCQRNGINMVSCMLEEHLKKVANITLKPVPS